MAQETKRQLFVGLALLGIIAYFLFFISVNVNPTLGSIYTLPILIAITLVIVDFNFGSKTIEFINRRNSWSSVFLWGIGGYIAVIFASRLAVGISKVVPLTEILSSLSASAPVFSNSPSLNFFTFAFLVAVTETAAFCIISLDVLATLFNIQINKRNLFNPKLIVIIFGLSLLFLLYHVNSKGLQDEIALITVFLMMVISLIVTVITLDWRPALIIHVIANSLASSAIFFSIFKISLPLISTIS